MLAIHTTPTSSKPCTPHLLPARINHNGRINNTERYWAPSVDDKGTAHAHFRGRHLHGTSLALPSSHTGVVLQITEKIAPQQPQTSHSTQSHTEEDGDEDDDDALPHEEVRIAEQLGRFDEVVVWGHGGAVEETGDEFVRGVREWIGFAGGMHCEDEEEEGQGAKA
ncbi:hypothetical protein E8E13_004942 [Curvularia kusanoi]|uniref:Uncharacterized protein n=1 Tax=Curvularia kusanoi TaxID=90978 RepID=A0A9P4W957_CURKU|nr:hypothetical protein E8E13_004942 [Curvularia kusanoi]